MHGRHDERPSIAAATMPGSLLKHQRQLPFTSLIFCRPLPQLKAAPCTTPG